MTDEIDRLERLSRLRQDGVLTEEEFQTHKSRLLTAPSGQTRLPILGAIVLAILAIAAVVYGLRGAKSVSSEAGAINAAGGSSVDQAASVYSPRSTDARVGSYEWAANEQIIGTNPDYLQAKLGPPRTKDGNIWTYDVEGCSISYTIGKDEITAFDAVIGEKCHPEVGERRLTERSNFGDVVGDYGSIYGADCLSMCGNAYDPPTYLIQQGPHANGFIDHIYYGFDYEASDAWRAALLKSRNLTEGEAPPDIYECATDPPPEAIALLKAYKIVGVQVGRNLADHWCGRRQ